MGTYILALDQGTTSSRAIVFDRLGDIVSKAQYPFRQLYPQAGWVEHDPMEIWETERRAAAQAAEGLEADIAGIGVTNQRETTILWDRTTGRPVYNAIVWQCRRTAELCEELKRQGLEERIQSATGLLIDAYFSATKIRWVLDNVPGAREKADRGDLLFGTVETWLIWQLTGSHVTDYSNASRTMLFDIHRLCWDAELCELLGVPMSILPLPVSNSQVYGLVKKGIPGLEKLAGTPVCGAAGDQQAALFGQTCFRPGEAKNTYGTGCFTLMNVGEKPVRSRAGLVTSVAWQVEGRTAYALEGSVFNGGSTIQWLRDELHLIDSAPECDRLAESVPDSGDGPDAGHAPGRRLRHHRPAGGRRGQRVGHSHAAAGGPAAHPRGPAGDGGDHRLRCGGSGGAQLRRVERPGGADPPAPEPAGVPAHAAPGGLRPGLPPVEAGRVPRIRLD